MNAPRFMRKLLGKPLWWWERHRPYPLREYIWEMPPYPLPDNRESRLIILTTPRTIAEAAWAARSILPQIPLATTFIIDGESPQGEQQLKKAFPGCHIVDTHSCVKSIAAACPSIAALAEYHPMGRKLAAILYAQKKSHILYEDDDVLAFDAMPEITLAMAGGFQQALYLQDVSTLCAEPTVEKAAKELGLDYLPTINVGFMLIPRNALNLQLAERLMSACGKIHTWFPDTMALAVLLKQTSTQALQRERYVVSAARQFPFTPDIDYTKIALRHFTQPVRHLMYMRGMPRLVSAWKKM